MNNLYRDLAPVTEAAWAEIELEASRTFKRHIAGRRVVDVSEPGGPVTAAVSTGRLIDVQAPTDGVVAHLRAGFTHTLAFGVSQKDDLAFSVHHVGEAIANLRDVTSVIGGGDTAAAVAGMPWASRFSPRFSRSSRSSSNKQRSSILFDTPNFSKILNR